MLESSNTRAAAADQGSIAAIRRCHTVTRGDHEGKRIERTIQRPPGKLTYGHLSSVHFVCGETPYSHRPVKLASHDDRGAVQTPLEPLPAVIKRPVWVTPIRAATVELPITADSPCCSEQVASLIVTHSERVTTSPTL
jgi:hypothetical protein